MAGRTTSIAMSRTAGFTLLELVIVIAIISTLATVALQRLLPWMDEAERVAVLRVEGQLRSTLVMEAAQRIARGRSESITDLSGSNPVNFLLDPPNNYVGELDDGNPGSAPVRHWYFDGTTRRLVYRLGEPYAIGRSASAVDDPAFSVNVQFADRDGNGRFEASRDELYGVRLTRMAGAEWLERGWAN